GQCTAPGVHPGDGTPRLFFFQAQIRLHLYTRQRPPRKRLRSNGQLGSWQLFAFFRTPEVADSAADEKFCGSLTVRSLRRPSARVPRPSCAHFAHHVSKRR
ncbi:MAG: hypothetical protein WB660_25505, partial [Candidatus Sulfotelmatobacter sp.]